MIKFRFFLGALMVLATTLMVDAQVRTSSNGVRSSNDNSVRTSTNGQNNTIRNSNSNISPAKPQISSEGNIRQNSSSNSVVNNQGAVRNSANNTSTNMQRNPSNSVRGNQGQSVRSNQGGNQGVSNPRGNNSNTRSSEAVRSTRVDNAPQGQSFSKNNVRYARPNPDRNQYHANNNAKFRQIRYNNYNYYIDDGYYYQYFDSKYRRVAAPYGMMVPTLPYGYSNIYISGNQYYYANGTYYMWDRNNYYVTQPPVGAIVYALPPFAEKVYINGQRYYEVDGAIYARVRFQGYRAYQVIGYIY